MVPVEPMWTGDQNRAYKLVITVANHTKNLKIVISLYSHALLQNRRNQYKKWGQWLHVSTWLQKLYVYI